MLLSPLETTTTTCGADESRAIKFKCGFSRIIWKIIRTRDPSGGGSGAGARWDRQKMGVKQPTHTMCPISVDLRSEGLPTTRKTIGAW